MLFIKENCFSHCGEKSWWVVPEVGLIVAQSPPKILPDTPKLTNVILP